MTVISSGALTLVVLLDCEAAETVGITYTIQLMCVCGHVRVHVCVYVVMCLCILHMRERKHVQLQNSFTPYVMHCITVFTWQWGLNIYHKYLLTANSILLLHCRIIHTCKTYSNYLNTCLRYHAYRSILQISGLWIQV